MGYLGGLAHDRKVGMALTGQVERSSNANHDLPPEEMRRAAQVRVWLQTLYNFQM
jgi:hypothetical protein